MQYFNNSLVLWSLGLIHKNVPQGGKCESKCSYIDIMLSPQSTIYRMSLSSIEIVLFWVIPAFASNDILKMESMCQSAVSESVCNSFHGPLPP